MLLLLIPLFISWLCLRAISGGEDTGFENDFSPLKNKQ